MSNEHENPATSHMGHCDGTSTEVPYYLVDARKRLVYVRFGKKLTAATITAYAHALRVDPEFNPTFAEIIDTRAVEEVTIRPQDAVALADAVDPFSLDSRRAFVACELAQINAARMHRILRSPSKNIGIFSSMAEAEAWVHQEIHEPPPERARKKARVLPFLPRHW